MDFGGTLGRGQSFPLENYKKGARVWHRDAELVWIGGSLLDDITFSTTNVHVRLENDEDVEYPITSVEQLPFIRNPDILIGCDDLTSLSYLHEPAVLHNLQHRFVNRKCVYTYCGIVLVAINPYADCAHLYSDDVIQVYRGEGKQVRQLDPHIYAVAEEAYFDLCEYGKNQSIIVSGESGAGKTVSAKFVMKYLATVAGGRAGFSGVEERVLASNPIMEAIGNAKTIRNDNSSRFGKFIQINFGDRFEISGAEMKTYLLEKSRLVFQAQNERNYHVFYQMCASHDHPLLSDFQLNSAEDYWYTSQGGDIYVDAVDDAKDFGETVRALEMLGFPLAQQKDVFRVLAGVLALGNIEFDFQGSDELAQISKGREAEISRLCSEVFQIDERQLRLWLTQREIRAAGEVVRKPLDRSEATRSRDALSKLLYAHLFGWVVDQINISLAKKEKSRRKIVEKFIGVLDIYGFETFDVNSFEQFCINYANEKLQQQFNQHVFKLEQEEYVREEISWVRIDFYDNQPCIELIEGRPGLIDYLDEQCKVVKGSDDGWLNQISNCPNLKKKDHLQMPKFRSNTFMVRHFAADVTYTVDGFMEKNKDTVSGQLLEVIGHSKFPFLRTVLGPIEDASSAGGKKLVKKTVAGQFRDSLRELMIVLEATRPHYVRCIKPNDVKENFYFEPKRAIQQLRACGVLETVRISAAGYPSRWCYEDFGRRYRVLYPEVKALWRDQPRKFAERACTKALSEGKFALGKTKIFFRTGQVAELERIRHETLAKSATKIQAFYRGFVQRRRYEQIRNNIRIMQATCRAFLAFRRLHYIQMQRAAVVIQAAVRKHQAEQRYNRLRTAVIAIQSAYRAQVVRREYEKMRFEKSALTIQRYFRGYMVRRERVKYIRKVIKVQCFVRRWLAKRRLKELKIEARSVGHLQKLNHGLENKIIELQQKLDVQTIEARAVGPLAVQKKQLEEKLHQVQKEMHEKTGSVAAQLEESAAEVAMLRTELGILQGERPSLLSAKHRMEELEMEVERLLVEVDVKDGERSEAENRLQTATSQMEQLRAEFDRKRGEMEDQMTSLHERVRELEEEKTRGEERLITESNRRQTAESEVSAMRDQLLANANLLANSGAFGKMKPENRSNSISLAGPDGKPVTVGSGNGDMDEIQLIMKQQHMINDLRRRCEQNQRENERLRSVIDSDALMENLDKKTSLRAIEQLRHQELEVAYQKLKCELERLVSEKATMGYEKMNVQVIMDKLIEENDRRREESAELRAMLSNRFDRQSVAHSGSPRPDSGHWSAAQSDAGSGSDLDEELCLERQCRQLKQHIESLNRMLTERNIEIEKMEKRLLGEMTPFTKTSDVSTEDSLRNVHAQLNHLVAENLSLNDKFLRQSEELSESRAQLRGYSGGLGTSIDGSTSAEADVVRLEQLSKENTEHSALLHVFNVSEFAKILVSDLKPRLAKLLTPNFPAYLLLTAFRYHDQSKDETGLTLLFTTVHIMLKDTVSRSSDMDVLSLWLVNTWRLFNLLRQYGEDENTEWHAANTEMQNSHRLRSFDLKPIRQQLAARVEECYSNLMKKAVEPVLAPKIVPGILQHESAAVMLMRDPTTTEKPSRSLDDLIDLLNFIHGKLVAYGADDVLLGQVFGRISEWICALALNHMMFRKELCNFEKAIQIKHNVTEIQSWLYEKGLSDHRDALEPLVQASHLLQSRKDESNIDTLCGEMTSKLLPKQVVAILQHYSPSDDFEESVIDGEFLDKVHAKLRERSAATGQDENKLIMRGTYLPPFETDSFVYSEYQLELLSLPSILHLQQVCKLL